ncbi:hypothetical protein AZO1586I_593 [Bathymodiolus thermophilus thioautotrophic gill symbiont]|uniref:Integrating conjugative element protein n=1 Tax=Bathymodiolus thermophilus thioautotrophic gill symbiont TaxID=2360 RepID=A0ABM8M7C1_9GAMM|nr:hypothetical protein [Bathymodiolus thermophilus thioautotrophic gill symbiont]CAB5500059.1 hypothetical protein AZO1586I_593 [Bathymodiolus thermophilus thioautotrophic gill symbiont]
MKNTLTTLTFTTLTLTTLTLTILTILTINVKVAHAINIEDDKVVFFDTHPELFYKIGGANRIRPPLTPDANVKIGLNGTTNLGYSCGEFDISANFANIMDGLKDGVDDAVNAVTNSANAAIGSLPSLVLQRALPGVYDMFQEYKLDAETEIDIANKSCEEMELEIARGENPYADFFQTAKSEDWREEAQKGTLLTKTKEKVEKNAGNNGVTEFGEKVGGAGQPPMKVVENAVIAGYNYAQGNTSNPTQSSSAPADTELGKTFPSSSDAVIWATDVLGEFEINNKEPITKIGSGLHPKIKQEKELAMEQLNKREFNELGFGPKVLAKIKDLSVKDQGSVYSNLIDDIAIERTIKRALIIRRLLLSGNQAETSNERDKKIALLERDIKSLMFERNVRQELTNNTILEVLKIRAIEDNQNDFKTPDNRPFS